MKHNYKNFKRSLLLFLLAGSGCADLLSQQTFTFTNAGATGRFGPTQTQVTNAYSTTNLSNSVTVNAGIQQFTVTPGVYRISAYGAQGGASGSNAGGLGARIEGDFTLTTTATLNILVGQHGENMTYNTGGGGGSFVWITGQAQPLVAAGGGGGAGYSAQGVNASTTTAGTSGSGAAGTPGTNGNGANPGGGGWLSVGANYNAGTSCPVKCTGNTAGVTVGGATPTTVIQYHGCAGSSDTGDGGFGGASGGNGNCTTSHGGGGGGGYSGGVGQSGSSAAGGGGGSYNGGSNQVNIAGANSGNGRVVIEELCSVKILSSSTGSLSPATLCSGNSLTLTTDAVSNFSWSTGQTTSSIVVAPNTNTVYSVIATSSMNCSASGMMNVVVSSAPPVLSIANPSNNICLGRTVTLTASGAVTYTWVNQGIVNGQPFTPASTAVYTVNGQNGCGITTATTTITVSQLPVSTLASPSLICQGLPSTLTAVSSVSGYTWEPGSLNGNTVVVGPLSTTIYTVTASDGTCSGTQTVALNTKPNPTVTVPAAFYNICEGQSITLTASGASSYTWSPGNANGSSITVNPAISTLYSVVGENSVNCTHNNQIAVVVSQGPTLSVTADKTTVCDGGSVTLQAAGADNYNWVNGPPTGQYNLTPAASGVYTVIGSHNTNSCTATETIAVNVIVPNVTFPANTSVCAGQTATLTASGASTYSWNSIATGTNNVFTIQPSATTTVTVIANTQSSSVNCPVSQSVQVVVNPLPSLTVTPARANMCRYETNTLTVTGAVSYDWGTLGSSNTVIITPTSTAASYTVTGTDGNSCTNKLTYQAKVNLCSGIDELNGTSTAISVYPNPNKGIFMVTAAQDLQLEVYNELGQQLRTIRVSEGSTNEINLSDLSNGIYFIKGQSEKGAVNHKIIISK